MTDATISRTGLAAPDSGLLTTSEQRWLGVRLTVALISGGCLILAAIIQIALPSQHDVAELVAGHRRAARRSAGDVRRLAQPVAIPTCMASPTS